MKTITLLLMAIIFCAVMSVTAQARYYDPGGSRFITPDTIVQNLYDPQTLNRYAYVRNNPLRYTDPTGHSFFGDIGNFFEHLTPQKAFAVVNPTAWIATMPLVNYGTSHRNQLIGGAENFVNHFSISSALELANPIFWASSTPMGWNYERTHPNQVGYAATAFLLFATGAYVPAGAVTADSTLLSYAASSAFTAEALSVGSSSLEFQNGDPTIKDVRGSVVFNNALREGAWGAASGFVQGVAFEQAMGPKNTFDRQLYYINNTLWGGAGLSALRGQNPLVGAAGGAFSTWYDLNNPSSPGQKYIQLQR